MREPHLADSRRNRRGSRQVPQGFHQVGSDAQNISISNTGILPASGEAVVYTQPINVGAEEARILLNGRSPGFHCCRSRKGKGSKLESSFCGSSMGCRNPESCVVFRHTTRAPRATVALSGCLLRATHTRADFMVEVG